MTIFCAIDTKDAHAALALAQQLRGNVHGLKLGLEFFLAHGMAGYQRIAACGMPIFLDLKLHDIPNQVSGAVESLLPLQPDFMTLHTAGGPAMMRAAVEAANKAVGKRPKLLGVTVLTSLSGEDLAAVGQGADAKQQVVRLAKLAKGCGLDGVVCSAEEIAPLRQELGPDFILMVPGIRPEWAAAGDQKRVMTPQAALQAGASYLVIGRPITEAKDPGEAARRIREEVLWHGKIKSTATKA